MLGTQVQKDSVTFCPDAAGEEAAADEAADADAAGVVDVPVAGGEVELLDEQPAATRTAMAAPAAAVTRRVLMSFMGVPPQ